MNEPGPIRVFPRDEKWLIDYGSYVCGYYVTRGEAIETAAHAAREEHRELVIDAPVTV